MDTEVAVLRVGSSNLGSSAKEEILDRMLSVENKNGIVPENRGLSPDWLSENAEINKLLSKVLGSETRVARLIEIINNDEQSIEQLDSETDELSMNNVLKIEMRVARLNEFETRSEMSMT